MVQDRAVLTMTDQWKVVCDLSNSTIFSQLERPLTHISIVMPLFDAEYPRNGTRYRFSYNEILMGTDTQAL